MNLGEDGQLCHGSLIATVEPVGEPILYRVGDCVPSGRDCQAIIDITKHLLELGLSFGLSAPASLTCDALPAPVIAHSDFRYPALAAFAPVKATVSSAAPRGHIRQLPRFRLHAPRARCSH